MPLVPGTILQRRFATLGPLLMGGVDDLGTLITVDKIAGWSGGTAATNENEQRAHDHGTWLGPSHLQGRTITVDLTLRALSFARAEASVDRILAAVPVGELATFVVTNPDGGQLQAQVRQGEAPLAAQKGAHARLSLSLFAPDPRRYATTLTTAVTGLPTTSGGLSLPISLPVRVAATVDSGVVEAVNAGNFATPPLLTVDGPVPPFALTHRGTGRTLRYHEPIPAGRRLVIDTDRRVALLDGTAPRRVTGAWFHYGPGMSEVAFTAAGYDAGSLLTSEHRSAWR